jgi:hypothetical protein
MKLIFEGSGHTEVSTSAANSPEQIGFFILACPHHLAFGGDKFDEADNWIVEHLAAGDIVITGDIQLADRCLKAGAQVLGHGGRPFTVNSIGAALAMRELSSQLRDMGEIKGGGPAFSQKDRTLFLNALEKAVQQAVRAG